MDTCGSYPLNPKNGPRNQHFQSRSRHSDPNKHHSNNIESRQSCRNVNPTEPVSRSQHRHSRNENHNREAHCSNDSRSSKRPQNAYHGNPNLVEQAMREIGHKQYCGNSPSRQSYPSHHQQVNQTVQRQSPPTCMQQNSKPGKGNVPDFSPCPMRTGSFEREPRRSQQRQQRQPPRPPTCGGESPSSRAIRKHDPDTNSKCHPQSQSPPPKNDPNSISPKVSFRDRITVQHGSPTIIEVRTPKGVKMYGSEQKCLPPTAQGNYTPNMYSQEMDDDICSEKTVNNVLPDKQEPMKHAEGGSNNPSGVCNVTPEPQPDYNETNQDDSFKECDFCNTCTLSPEFQIAYDKRYATSSDNNSNQNTENKHLQHKQMPEQAKHLCGRSSNEGRSKNLMNKHVGEAQARSNPPSNPCELVKKDSSLNFNVNQNAQGNNEMSCSPGNQPSTNDYSKKMNGSHPANVNHNSSQCGKPVDNPQQTLEVSKNDTIVITPGLPTVIEVRPANKKKPQIQPIYEPTNLCQPPPAQESVCEPPSVEPFCNCDTDNSDYENATEMLDTGNCVIDNSQQPCNLDCSIPGNTARDVSTPVDKNSCDQTNISRGNDKHRRLNQHSGKEGNDSSSKSQRGGCTKKPCSGGDQSDHQPLQRYNANVFPGDYENDQTRLPFMPFAPPMPQYQPPQYSNAMRQQQPSVFEFPGSWYNSMIYQGQNLPQNQMPQYPNSQPGQYQWNQAPQAPMQPYQQYAMTPQYPTINFGMDPTLFGFPDQGHGDQYPNISRPPDNGLMHANQCVIAPPIPNNLEADFNSNCFNGSDGQQYHSHNCMNT